jgi:enolase
MSEAIIESMAARSLFDSRGNPTVEVEVVTKGGYGSALAPSGASAGVHEVVSYPKGGVDEGVRLLKAMIEPRLVGFDSSETTTIDGLLHELDGTKDFSRLGGNICLAVSLAAAKAASASRDVPLHELLSGDTAAYLPHPLGNVLGGGKHAGKNAPDIQEFLVLPVKAGSFREMASANIAVHRELRRLLEKTDSTFTGGKGDEGAWAPNLSNEKALGLVAEAAETVSKGTGVEIRVGLDVASSSLWDKKSKTYVYEREGVQRNRGEQIDFMLELIKRYSLAYVEDPLDEEDFEGFSEVTSRIGESCMICGDDLFTTNTDRLARGIKLKAGNAIIIKPNQIGTLTDTLRAVKMAKGAGYVPIASHRSGETCDPYLAHLAVGYECPVVKLGVLGGERLSKVNELLRIEESLGSRARVAKLSSI